tara:strand:+ start:2448 stop:2747 length:300 start_codon:yes stop_codon:yes gene_type:complete
MLKISISRLADIELIEDVEILSIDCALYTVRAIIQGQQYRVVDKRDKPYTKNSVEHIKKDLHNCNIKSLALVHQSAFDEMVGQPNRESSNAIRVPLSLR